MQDIYLSIEPSKLNTKVLRENSILMFFLEACTSLHTSLKCELRVELKTGPGNAKFNRVLPQGNIINTKTTH